MVRSTFNRKLLLAVVALFAVATFSQAKTTLLVFSSPTCGPCQQLKPTISRLAQEGYPIQKIDITQQKAVARQFGVDRVPTMVMVADGRELARRQGGDTADNIRRMFKQVGFQLGRVADVQSPVDSPAIERPTLPRNAVVPASMPSKRTPPAAAFVNQSHFSQKLVACTVRITVDDAQAKSYGTGTIVDTRDQDALVLTCGHLFREYSDEATILIEVFSETAAGLQVIDRTVGKLESYDLDRDVGLVSFRPRTPVTVAKVAPEFSGQVNDPVWSVGCDKGADPTVRDSHITDIDRYHGPSNIETTGAPVVGRSGGGLFNEQGQLVGVCYAADEEADEGLYAGLPSIHAELDRLGLTAIYASNQAVMPASASQPKRLAPLPAGPDTVVRGQTPEPFPTATTPPPAAFPQAPPTVDSLTIKDQAALLEVARRAVQSEVVVIVRPKDASGQSEVLKLDGVSEEFVSQLRRLSR